MSPKHINQRKGSTTRPDIKEMLSRLASPKERGNRPVKIARPNTQSVGRRNIKREKNTFFQPELDLMYTEQFRN